MNPNPPRNSPWFCAWLVLASCFSRSSFAQQPLTWQQLRAKFEASNPTLRAGQLSIDEARAMEITAYLRPNPDLTISADGTQLTPSQGVWRPFAGTQYGPSVSYLHEREHKRELRLDSAVKGTAIARAQQDDLERNLLFTLRGGFNQILQARAVLALAQENLNYYDNFLKVSRDRLNAGDIARVDLDRLELQRIQYESDIQTALVNVRTAKIQLQQLLADRTPVEQFEVTGPFDFTDPARTLEEFRRIAADSRPDLQAALRTVEKANTDHQLAVSNGSTDPTFAGWVTHNPSFNNPFDNNSVGVSVTIPLRIFDHNQGEKERTAIDIRRNQRLAEAAASQVFSDVDTAYATLNSNLTLLRPYKSTYLDQAARVRDTIAFAYQRGGASLLDFLSAENEYRSVRLNYLNLVGAYMTAASQLNLAVGREVIQ
ncbi:MAG: TolC family protein [Acidobacteriota bacterium]